MTLHLLTVGTNPVIAFAAGELRKYLRLMSDAPCDIGGDHAHPLQGPCIRIGLFSDFGFNHTYDRAIDDLDDEIRVDVSNGSGVIAGLNFRSVVFAVYRFLHENGVRFLRPGADGELIPERSLTSLSASLSERASRRHRGICIEGASGFEHVVALVDWAAKVGYSAYFMQFKDGHVFFRRWYSQHGNPMRPPKPLSLRMSREFTIRIEEELRKRGMVYHSVGHGWTTEALGYSLSHWDAVALPITEAQRQHLALVNGKRDFSWGIPMITSLCYSNPEVRRNMVLAVVNHAEKHPETDLLHFWLDDGCNNKCECPDCASLRVSDYYLMMLNEIDAELTRRNIDMKIVFLAYNELLWPPQGDTRIRNPHRFVLMYANARPSYDRSLLDGPNEPVPPFVRNSVQPIRSIGLVRAFLRAWKDLFPGDSFHFDYYNSTQWSCFNSVHLARRIMQDVRDHNSLQLGGIMSVGTQRNAMPNALCDYAVGRVLWNAKLDAEKVIAEYMHAAYGSQWAESTQLIENIGSSFTKSLRFFEKTPGKTLVTLTENAEHLVLSMQTDATRLKELSVEGARDANATQARIWTNTAYFAELVLFVADILGSVIARDFLRAENVWKQCTQFIHTTELEYACVVDSSSLVGSIEYIYKGLKSTTDPQSAAG